MTNLRQDVRYFLARIWGDEEFDIALDNFDDIVKVKIWRNKVKYGFWLPLERVSKAAFILVDLDKDIFEKFYLVPEDAPIKPLELI